MSDKFKVLEVDQWTSTAKNIGDYSLEDFELGQANINSLHGGDSEAIKRIYGGDCRIIEVTRDDRPSIARVWYKNNSDGKLTHYLHNYDSSD